MLIDEVMTPDSSRFWAVDVYKPGQGQPSFDKQPLRDYLDGERRAKRWNGEAPPPPLPRKIVDATSTRYLDLYRRLASAPRGKLILVTAINPTPAGEGKTTTSIGLTDALNRIGKRAPRKRRLPRRSIPATPHGFCSGQLW